MHNHTTYPSLAVQCVFITGGATDIGAALVRAFTQQKARVVFIDQNSEQRTALVSELNNQPQIICLDITQPRDLQQTIAEAGKEAPLTVLINNAANDMRQSLQDVDQASWRVYRCKSGSSVFCSSGSSANHG